MGAFRRKWPGLSYGRGEDWHYVGATDEPAFESGWDNSATIADLAYRMREAGYVDIHGVIKATAGPPSPYVFTIPERYRPASGISPFMLAMHERSTTRTPTYAYISSAGAFTISGASGFLTDDVVYVSGAVPIGFPTL